MEVALVLLLDTKSQTWTLPCNTCMVLYLCTLTPRKLGGTSFYYKTFYWCSMYLYTLSYAHWTCSFTTGFNLVMQTIVCFSYQRQKYGLCNPVKKLVHEAQNKTNSILQVTFRFTITSVNGNQ